MPLYEHVFIARQDISAQRMETHIRTFGGIITEHGGRVAKKEYWGLRTLAYRIRKNKRGHYALMNLEAPHEAITELERRMRLHEDVLRFLTMRVAEHDETPSPPMQKAQAVEERRAARKSARTRSETPPQKAEDTAEATTEATTENTAEKTTDAETSEAEASDTGATT